MARKDLSVLIVEARFYGDIADQLAAGAIGYLEQEGVSYERLEVPGALELPIALAIALKNGVVGEGAAHQGCVALGCVIRGETSHYDIVAGESAGALARLAGEHGVPLGNGVLTVENHAQAEHRARADGKNKGRDAAAACVALIEIAQRWRNGAAAE